MTEAQHVRGASVIRLSIYQSQKENEPEGSIGALSSPLEAFVERVLLDREVPLGKNERRTGGCFWLLNDREGAMLLGTVTYNIAKDWDLPTILSRLEELRFAGVELRTTHRHGVEVSLSPRERLEVRKRFENSPVELAGLGSAFEYHSNDPEEVKRNVAGTKEYVRLAHDVGAPGVKVRPNGVPRGDDLDTTLKRIGAALREVGEDAAGFGVEIRVEVHGNVTQLLPNIAKMIAYADHPNVFVCWNSNPTDVVEGSIAGTFDLVAERIREVHLRDLTDGAYPWRDLFGRLKGIRYQGYTLAEIPESSDPMRVLRYFRSLWLAYQPAGDSK
jgi:sugar phosphate isomerase/epimerase